MSVSVAASVATTASQLGNTCQRTIAAVAASRATTMLIDTAVWKTSNQTLYSASSVESSAAGADALCERRLEAHGDDQRRDDRRRRVEEAGTHRSAVALGLAQATVHPPEEDHQQQHSRADEGGAHAERAVMVRQIVADRRRSVVVLGRAGTTAAASAISTVNAMPHAGAMRERRLIMLWSPISRHQPSLLRKCIG